MTFEQFKIAYRAAFVACMTYTPSQVGSGHYSAKMADLADAHPDYLDAYEAELDEAAYGAAAGAAR